jgi:exonuclease SbcD
VRFLHTADWHVGKTLRGRSRMDEMAAAIDEVVRLSIDARVDAVLLAGDVFDSAAPAPEAERLVFDFLARLLPERIACVLIAGNHDHPRKLGALTRLLEGLRIFVRTEIALPEQGGVVRLASRDGSETARIVALPFLPERRVIEACRLLDPDRSWQAEYGRRIEEVFDVLSRGRDQHAVHLGIAHLLVSGARTGSGERPLHLTEAFGVEAAALPSDLQYLALGHLHRPQEIAAPSPTRYAGSLIELDFGEVDQDKRVVLVEAAPGRAAVVESIPLSAGRRLRDVETSLDRLEALAGEVGQDLLRVTLHVPAPEPGLAERVKEHLPNALDVRLVYEQEQPEPPRAPTGLDPLALFQAFHHERHGQDPGEALQRLFREVYEEAT